MPVEKNNNYPHPNNMDCTYIDPKGIECARIGCCAEALIENAADPGGETSEAVEEIETLALNAGCSYVSKRRWIQIEKAKNVIRNIYNETPDDLTEEERLSFMALNGVCGSCVSLAPAFVEENGKETAKLSCKAKKNPIELYGEVSINVEPYCSGFTNINK